MKALLAYLVSLILLTPFAVSAKPVIGSGSFALDGAKGRLEKRITVHYHLPKAHNNATKVILVLPGAGRNGDDYRDTWIGASEQYNLLILSPSYSEDYYPRFWNYNLAGMIKDVRINRQKTAIADYTIVADPAKWLFNDFDRIFEDAVTKFALLAKSYDIFGHSAGGQIVHRLALSNVKNKAHRLLASNSGWYTVPTFNEPFPYGLNGLFHPEHLAQAFNTDLTLFLGELDNQHETRGHLVRNPQLDIQGRHRLSRGKYFFNKGREMAEQQQLHFNWKLHIVEDVGHDYRKMGKAAAEYLYSKQ